MSKKISQSEVIILQMADDGRYTCARCPIHGVFARRNDEVEKKGLTCPYKDCTGEIERIDDPKAYAEEHKRKGKKP